MGYHSHNILKCHTCKSRRAGGDSKRDGQTATAKRGGWAFTKTEVGAWIWLCPACARKHQLAESSQFMER
jgi:hypothetical protein